MKIKLEKEDSEFKDFSIDQLREVLAKEVMTIKALEEQKRTYTKSINDLIKATKVKRGEILEILEAKDASMARKVLVEVTRKP